MSLSVSGEYPHSPSSDEKVEFLLMTFSHIFGTYFGKIPENIRILLAEETPDLLRNGNEVLIPGIENVYRYVLGRLRELGIEASRQKI